MIIVSIGYNTALREFIGSNFMPRQNISLTEQNDLWLRNQVEYVGKYANKSELVNDLIRRARKAEVINKKSEMAEINEFTEQSPQEVLAEFKLLLLQVNTSQFN
jgi:antitoxin ParD1/3/4